MSTETVSHPHEQSKKRRTAEPPDQHAEDIEHYDWLRQRTHDEIAIAAAAVLEVWESLETVASEHPAGSPSTLDAKEALDRGRRKALSALWSLHLPIAENIERVGAAGALARVAVEARQAARRQAAR